MYLGCTSVALYMPFRGLSGILGGSGVFFKFVPFFVRMSGNEISPMVVAFTPP